MMCLGVRSVRVLKTFLPKLYYFRYLNPLTPVTTTHLNTSLLNATLFTERCTSMEGCLIRGYQFSRNLKPSPNDMRNGIDEHVQQRGDHDQEHGFVQLVVRNGTVDEEAQSINS